ncbi:MAG: hypothetical protein NTV34_02305 [Proteobacteria bacterium]|nr:hypothetical protein [Pseudomonadota bacterium]
MKIIVFDTHHFEESALVAANQCLKHYLEKWVMIWNLSKTWTALVALARITLI